MIELAMNHERCQGGLPGVARRGVSVHWARQGHRCERHRQRGSGGPSTTRCREANRTAQRHGEACLRRAMFRTRNAPAQPPRHHAACRRGAMFPAGCCGWPMPAPRGAASRWSRKHRPTRTSRAVAGSSAQGQRSGCEHGSTVASTVVALDAGLTDETNDQDNEAAVLTPTTGNRP